MGQWGDSLWKEAYSWIPQSTVGCITNIAWVKMQDYIETHNKNWDLLINCHDSILMQAPLAERDEAAKVLQSFMTMPLTATDGITQYRMKSEVCSGLNWSKKSSTNPEGMDEIKLAA
jgi:DNA polymerase I-like protein with 3'-5' exonuclease and polymerase domains